MQLIEADGSFVFDGLDAGEYAVTFRLGGAVSLVPADATAFPDRLARYWINVYGFWSDAAQDAQRIAWTRSE